MANNLRFVKAEDYAELINLYHLARTALSGKDDSRHARMIWASKEWAKIHTYTTATGAYKDLSADIYGYHYETSNPNLGNRKRRKSL